MSKTTILGDAIVITSTLTTEEIKTIAKFKPKALALYEGDGADKVQTFAIGIGSSGFHTGTSNTPHTSSAYQITSIISTIASATRNPLFFPSSLIYFLMEVILSAPSWSPCR